MAEGFDGSVRINAALDAKGFEKGSEEMRRAVDELGKEIEAVGATISQGVSQSARTLQEVAEAAETTSQGMTGSAEQAVQAQQQVTDAAQQTAQAQQEVADATRQATQAQQELNSAAAQAQQQRNSATDQSQSTGFDAWRFPNAASEQEKTAEAANEVQSATQAATMSVKDYEKALQKVAAKIEELKLKLSAYNEALEQVHLTTDALLREAETDDQAANVMQIEEQQIKKLNNAYYRQLHTLNQLEAQYKSLAEAKADAQAKEQGSLELNGRDEKLQAMDDSLTRVVSISREISFKPLVSGAKKAFSLIKLEAQQVYAQVKVLATISFHIAATSAKGFITVVRSIGSTALKAASSLGKLASKIMHIGKRSRKSGLQANMLVKSLMRIKTMLIGRVKRSFVTSLYDVMKDVATSMKEFSAEYSTALSRMKAAMTELSANVMASVSQIIVLVEPFITSLLLRLSDIASYISGFASIFQGKSTMTVAKQQINRLNGELTETAEEAEEAKRQLAGFDELNILSKGKDDDEVKDLYEEVPIDEALPENLKSYFDDLKELWDLGFDFKFGNKLAEGLNEIIQTVNDWITDVFDPQSEVWAGRVGNAFDGFFYGWDAESTGMLIANGLNAVLHSVGAFMEEINGLLIGGRFANLINGFFNNVEWDTLGSDIATGVNTITDIVRGFAENAQWAKWGKNVSASLNSFFQDVHWDAIGQTLGENLDGILRFFHQFVTRSEWQEYGKDLADLVNQFFGIVDWDLLGRSFSDPLNAIFGFFAGFARETKWEEIGRDLAASVNGFFDNIHWDDIVDAFVGSINGLVSAATEFVTGLHWSEYGDDLSSRLMDIILHVDWQKIGTLFAESLNGVINYIYSVLTGFDWVAVGMQLAACVNKFIKETDWEKAGDTLSEVFHSILRVAVGFIGTLDLGEMVNSFLAFAEHLLRGIAHAIEEVDWQELGKRMVKEVKKIKWSGVVSAIAELLGAEFGSLISLLGGAIGEAVQDIINYFKKKIEEDKNKFGELGGSIFWGILQGIIDGITNIASWIEKNVLTPFIKGFKEAFGIHSPSTVMQEQGGYIIEGMLQGILNAFADIKNWLKEHIFSPFTDKFKELFGMGGTSNSNSTVMAGFGSTLIGSLKSGAESVWDKAQKTFSGFGEAIVDTFTKKESPMTETGEGLVKNLHSGINASWKDTDKDLNDYSNSAVDTFANKSNSMNTAGQSMVNNLRSGIGSSWSDVNQDLTGYGNSVVDAFSYKNDSMNLAGQSMVNNLRSGINSSWNDTQTTINGYSNTIVNSFSRDTDMQITGQNSIYSFKSGMDSGWNYVAPSTYGMADQINGVFDNREGMASKGWWNMWGLYEGLSSGWENIKTAVGWIAEGVLNTFKGIFQIGSPSKVMHNYGEFLDLGLVGGIEDEGDTVLKTVSNLASAVTDGVEDSSFTFSTDTTGLQSSLDVFSNTIADSFQALGDRLQAISENVSLRMPDIAAGNVVPYKTALGEDTDVLSDTIRTSNEELGSVFIQSMNNVTAAIISAIQASGGSSNSISLDPITTYRTFRDEHNRTARILGHSELLI